MLFCLGFFWVLLWLAKNKESFQQIFKMLGDICKTNHSIVKATENISEHQQAFIKQIFQVHFWNEIIKMHFSILLPFYFKSKNVILTLHDFF